MLRAVAPARRGARSSAAAGATSTRCSRGCARAAASRSSSRRRSTRVHRDARGVTRRRGRRASSASIASIVATHADTALALLAAPTDDERARARRVPLQPRTAPCCTRDRAFLPRRAARARGVELRRRSRHRARRGHVLDDPPAGPARRAVPRHAQPARASRAASLHEVVFAHPQFDRAALAAQAELAAARRRARARTTPARTSASASTRTACAPGSPPPRARSPTTRARQRDAFESALYRGELIHARDDAHARRAFRYPVYMAALDLDELPALDRELRLFSHDRREPVLARTIATTTTRRSHARCDALRAANGCRRRATTRLVTNLRVARLRVQPGQLLPRLRRARRADVGRSPRSTTPTAAASATCSARAQRIAPRTARSGSATSRELFVSPFLHGPRDLRLPVRRAARRRAPRDRRCTSTRRTATACSPRALAGARAPLTDRALAAAALRYPLMTAQVIGLIH